MSGYKFQDDLHFSIEPGRAVVANAGTIITSVIGIARRSQETWVYVDAGIYQGLFEIFQSNGDIEYPVSVSSDSRNLVRYTIGGPTCDSSDVIATNIMLPQLKIGDRIAFHQTGAYTTSVATQFNGFDSPKTLYLND